MEYWINIILLFFIYSFAGWCMEVILKYRQYHRFINRGFLTGPVCPIYGCGAVLITVVIGNLTSVESGLVMTFSLSFVICGVVEYLTSLVLEKIFHARWWDYSQKPMNLHGRVWIGNLILFGLGGVAIIHIINPPLFRLFERLSLQTREIIDAALLCVFAADYAVTHFVLKLVKSGIERSEADNTEEINREIRVLLSDRNIFYRRFADAYPEVVYRTERINARLAAIKAETEKIRREAEERITARMEPTAMIKNTIIEKQDALIGMLYDETTATEEMKRVKHEIEGERKRLQSRPLARLRK